MGDLRAACRVQGRRREGTARGLRGTWSIALLLALMACIFGGAAQAGPNLVLNGGFAQDTLSPANYTSFQIGSYTYSSTSYTGSLTSWTVGSGGYNYVFASGTSTAIASYGTASLLDGTTIANSPAGGNFLVSDANAGSGAISQSVSGLSVGVATTLTFYWAAAQQSGYSGATTQYWQVSLGSVTKDTTTYSLGSGAFSGWMAATMTFIPTSTSEVLSFLAVGTGSPPLLLLDGVTLGVPEPATWAVLVAGLVGLGVVVRRRRCISGLNL
jgi:hypothetical protein